MPKKSARKAVTKKTATKKYDGSTCPKCNADNLTVVQSIEPLGNNQALQDVLCLHCNTRFTEYYRLVMLVEADDEDMGNGTSYPVAD